MARNRPAAVYEGHQELVSSLQDVIGQTTSRVARALPHGAFLESEEAYHVGSDPARVGMLGHYLVSASYLSQRETSVAALSGYTCSRFIVRAHQPSQEIDDIDSELRPTYVIARFTRPLASGGNQAMFLGASTDGLIAKPANHAAEEDFVGPGPLLSQTGDETALLSEADHYSSYYDAIATAGMLASVAGVNQRELIASYRTLRTISSTTFPSLYARQWAPEA